MSWLLFLAACRPPLVVVDPPDSPADTEDSAADTEDVPPGPREIPLRDGLFANHLLPYDVVVDPVARRAYSLSLAFGNLAVIDIDAGLLLDVIPVANAEWPDARDARPPGPVSLALSADGAVWILGGDPPLTRVDPVARRARVIPTELVVVVSLFSRADGAVLVGGATVEEVGRIDVLDSSFTVAGSFLLPEAPRGVIATGDETFATLLRSGLIETRRSDDGSLVGSCPAQHEANTFAPLPTGDFVVIDGVRTTLVPCSGGPTASLPVGRDQQAVMAIPGGVLVLDRLSAIPHLAVARRYDSALDPLGAGFATGNHTGYGEADAVTGLVWANAEGTTEVVALDPVAGALVARVRTGQHVEEAVRDPADVDRAFVVGRLTDTFAAVDLATGEVTPIAGPRWPMAPVVVDRTLFVVGGIDQRLYAFDADTLEAAGSWDLGLAPNHGYTLPDMAWDADREALFVSGGDVGAVVAFDPVAGAVVGAPIAIVPHGFPADVVNRLEVRIGAEAVFVVRAADGMVGRLVPETGEVTSGSPVAGLLEVTTRMSISAIGADGTLWVGPWAVDPVTLERVPDVEAPWTFPIAPEGDAMLGWDRTTQSLVRVNPDGAVEESWVAGPFGNADPAVELLGGRVLFTHLREGVVYDWPL